MDSAQQSDLAAALDGGLIRGGVKCGTWLCLPGGSGSIRRLGAARFDWFPQPTPTGKTTAQVVFAPPAPTQQRVQRPSKPVLRGEAWGHRHERPGEDGGYRCARPHQRTDLLATTAPRAGEPWREAVCRAANVLDLLLGSAILPVWRWRCFRPGRRPPGAAWCEPEWTRIQLWLRQHPTGAITPGLCCSGRPDWGLWPLMAMPIAMLAAMAGGRVVDGDRDFSFSGVGPAEAASCRTNRLVPRCVQLGSFERPGKGRGRP